jgi:hypothetical protein
MDHAQNLQQPIRKPYSIQIGTWKTVKRGYISQQILSILRKREYGQKNNGVQKPINRKTTRQTQTNIK